MPKSESKTSRSQPKRVSSRAVRKTSRQPNKEVTTTAADDAVIIPDMEPTTQKPAHWWTWKKGVLLTILALVILGVGYWLNALSSTSRSIIDSDNNTPLLEQLGIILTGENRPLVGEAEDRINVLLLGIGGDGHAGGTLTDSIMVASLEPSTGQVALLSLPRDLVVKIYDDENPKYWEGRKINYAYEVGGMDLAVEKVSEVTGLDLNYYVLMDFSGFRSLVDDVSGVTIDIDRSFTGLYGANELSLPCPTAQLYYLDDGAYCAIDFQRGVEHMDGERALIFARVRKLAPGSSNSEEGSDFARGQRQQKILEGFKDTLFSASTLTRPGRVKNVMDSLGDHLKTNMELWEMARLAEMVKDVNNDDIISRVIDNSPQGLLYSKIYEPTGAYVLVPQAGEYNFSEIHTLANNIFEHAETIKENAVVQVLNGTSQNGLAAKAAEQLQLYDIDVAAVGNAPDQEQLMTKIYDLTNNEKTLSLELIQGVVGGTLANQKDVDKLLASDVTGEYFDSTVDFIIILGENAKLNSTNSTESSSNR